MNPVEKYYRTSSKFAELIRLYRRISTQCQTLTAECEHRLELLEQKRDEVQTAFWTLPLDPSKLDLPLRLLQSMEISDKMLEEYSLLTQDMLSLTLTLAKLKLELSHSFPKTKS